MPASPDSPDSLDTLDAAAAAASFSGVISLQRPGRPLVERAYGLADRRWQVPNTPDTIFATASCAKTFTALTVMSLVLDGTLTLDTTARSLLRTDLPEVADDVTVEHLLAHRTGIGDSLDEEQHETTDFVLPFPPHRYLYAADYLTTLDGYPTVFPAGDRFAYNNGGYVVLAVLAERAAGVPYHDLVQERVIGPAGLVDTAFQRADEPLPRTATGYLQATGWRTNTLHMPLRGVGDGGLFTTVADLRTFWAALIAGRVLPTATVAEMIRPRSDVPEEKARYGLGFWLHPTADQVRLIGSDAGVSLFSGYRPGTGEILTVVSNWSDGGWPMVRHLGGWDG
jgi:CubicO group peptidase (beta-lactamase class C family)